MEIQKLKVMKFKKEDLHPDGRPYTQEEFINKIKTDDEFAKKWGELGPIYGKQWRSWTYQTNEWYDGKNHYDEESKTIDQIANLIRDLKTNPDSRRLMVNAWNVGELVIGYQLEAQRLPDNGVGSLIQFTGIDPDGVLNRGGRTLRTAAALERAVFNYAETPTPSVVLNTHNKKRFHSPKPGI